MKNATELLMSDKGALRQKPEGIYSKTNGKISKLPASVILFT